MSRHEGVSCDYCLKGNFRGKRYKCLICYDYDLCATCYEKHVAHNRSATTHHTTEHPMQCILTRSDFDLYYGGEAISVEQPQAFSCPFCGKMGYTELSLQEHVSSDHSESSLEVVCPVCASLPGGDPNNITDDFASHLTLEHRSPRELDETSGSRHIRRIPHPGRGMSSNRARRTQMQFNSSSGLPTLSPGSRDSMDPISELLSQLSGVRRTINLAQSTTSQLQQLQMQLQLERQQAQAARQQLERLPRRQAQVLSSNSVGSNGSASASVVSLQSHYAVVFEPSTSPSSTSLNSQFLLSRCTEPSHSETELQSLEIDYADRSLFARELLLSSLTKQLNINLDFSDITSMGQLLKSNNYEVISPPESACEKNTSAIIPSKETSGTVSSSTTIPSHHQWTTSQAHHTENFSHHNQSPRNTAPRKSTSTSLRHSGRNRGGTSSSNPTQSVRDIASQPISSARSGTTSFIQQVTPREAFVGNRQISRANGRETGASPAAARRKVLRQVDDRNKSTDPPPH